jgi:hypothetical protein
MNAGGSGCDRNETAGQEKFDEAHCRHSATGNSSTNPTFTVRTDKRQAVLWLQFDRKFGGIRKGNSSLPKVSDMMRTEM